MDNLKTTLFFILILGLGLLPWALKQKKDYRKALDIFYAQSENAREIYTGELRAVFEPLDEAYKVSKKLENLIKTVEIPIKESDPWSVISILSDPEDLYSEDKGIIVNGYKKGRLWERASYIKYFEKRELLFQSFAGLRQHGGTSRSPHNKLKSFRLYFKKKYGESEFLPNQGLTLKENTKIKRLVLRRDKVLHFANDISFHLINKLGGIAPNLKHVKFYLNGEFYGHHTITEHLSTEQLKFFWGHENFTFAKIKGDKDITSRVLYNDVRDRLELSELVNFDYVDSQIDVDSMMGSLLVIMYTGNTDWSQGVYTKDLKNNSKWKLISWDFDRAFYPVRESTIPGMKHDYEMKSVRLGMDIKKGKIRWSIFNRLIHDDSKFRDYFSKKVDELHDILNSKEFKARLLMYESLAQNANSSTPAKDLKQIRLFIKGRWREFCKSLEKDVHLSAQSCKI
jgi:hypothetical protein